MKDIIFKHTLKNAFEYGGKVNPNVVLGLVLKENPELKRDVLSLRKEIGSIIPQVEILSPWTNQTKITTTCPRTFSKHSKNNDFHNFVKDVHGDGELAVQLLQVSGRDNALSLIQKRIAQMEKFGEK